MTTRSSALCLAAALLVATAARGQTAPIPPPTRFFPAAERLGERRTVQTVRIRLLTRPDCPALPAAGVWVIAADSDREIAIRDGQKMLIFDLPQSFNARSGHVSLRIGPKPAWRTDCHQQTRLDRDDPQHPKEWVAEFTFSACPAPPVHQVSIHTDPPAPEVHVAYVREMQASGAGDPDEGKFVDCAEGAFLLPIGTINTVQYDREKLHVQIAKKAPNLKACGIVVNDPAATKYAKANRDDRIVFERAGLSAALIELRSKTKACAAPSFSLPASELDRQNLNETRLTTLEVSRRPQPDLPVK
jgi:hypothetical protein